MIQKPIPTNTDEALIDLTADKQQPEQTTPEWLLSLVNGTMPPSDNDTAATTWFARNDTARTSWRDMRKVLIAEQRIGLGFVSALQEAKNANQTKAIDVTGNRRERKSVLPSATWDVVEKELQERGISLVNREKAGAAEGRTRATLTYYGTSAVFYNHQVRTKIRMRIRYYLSYVRNEDGSITDVQREGATKNKGFLELKVKSPRANDPGSVDKYRVLVSDNLISQLVNLDATTATFLNDLELVKQAVQKEAKPEEALVIATMFQIIGKLSKRKASFIRPSLVISYERNAFKYIEEEYAIPVFTTESGQNKRPSLHRSSRKSNKKRRKVSLWGRRFGRRDATPVEKSEDTETSSDAGSDQEPLSASRKSTKQNVELRDIEYQFTIDRNVRAHYPLLPVPGATKMPVAEHFDVNNQTELMSYPAEARVVEFKEPLIVANLPEKDRSNDHNSLISVLVNRMENQIMWGDYDENVGKYGNFRRRLMEEHHTNRIKNEMIQIDFSGTGDYQH